MIVLNHNIVIDLAGKDARVEVPNQILLYCCGAGKAGVDAVLADAGVESGNDVVLDEQIRQRVLNADVANDLETLDLHNRAQSGNTDRRATLAIHDDSFWHAT